MSKTTTATRPSTAGGEVSPDILTRPELERLQLERLQWTVHHGKYRRVCDYR